MSTYINPSIDPKIAYLSFQVIRMVTTRLKTNPYNVVGAATGKFLSEALLFAEHGENLLCTKIVLNVGNNFCTQHVLPRFELRM